MTTGKNVRIRPLRTRDYPAVKQIERIIVDEYLQYLKETKEDDTVETWINRDYFSHYVRAGASYVAQVDRNVVGFILSQPSSYVHYQKRELWLDFIAVLPERRRNGIGTALISKVISHSAKNGIRLLYTTLNPNNAESIGFLKKHEFQVRDWMQATRDLV